MICAAVGQSLQMLDRGCVRPLLIAPTVGKDDMLVAIAASSFLFLEEKQNVPSFECRLHASKIARRSEKPTGW
jgi:hypothetical protein